MLTMKSYGNVLKISSLQLKSLSSEVKESVAENAAFGKTFTKPLKFEDNVENRDNFIMSAENSMEYRNNSALDEEEEQYEEDDNWEKFRLPDILHDTQAKTYIQEGNLCYFLKLSRSVYMITPCSNTSILMVGRN